MSFVANTYNHRPEREEESAQSRYEGVSSEVNGSQLTVQLEHGGEKTIDVSSRGPIDDETGQGFKAGVEIEWERTRTERFSKSCWTKSALKCTRSPENIYTTFLSASSAEFTCFIIINEAEIFSQIVPLPGTMINLEGFSRLCPDRQRHIVILQPEEVALATRGEKWKFALVGEPDLVFRS
ncbi:hypothetical protein L5D93_28285 [Paenibacillus thiaminolyticus]|nr:hypothetical protein [Paenibacillus thiaminolyticus]